MVVDYLIVRPRFAGLTTWVRSDRSFYGHDADECHRQAIRWLEDWMVDCEGSAERECMDRMRDKLIRIVPV